ncbi:MAG: glycosyltransferase, partial [Muribaculaceae bacterium]|nr:glycosyltransferase [Muribaculaceae bacterium]
MKISIITPVFNREDTLLRCLESVTAALTENIDIEVEHIVVDDGSI